MRLVVASLTPIAPAAGGRWRAFNRVAEVAEELTMKGWQTTLIGRNGEAGHSRYLVDQDVAVVTVRRHLRAWRDWWRAASVVARADSVLVFMPSLACALLALLAGGRTVVYAGGTWGQRDDYARWRGFLERLVARRARATVVSGHAVADYYTGSARRIEITVPLVPPPVRERFLRPLPDRAGEPLRILFVGWIQPKKGIVELLDAVAGLAGAECRVVGPVDDDRLAALVRRRAAEHGPLEYVGYVEWPELAAHYEWANVLALPSHTEGFPRVAFEASAYGLALVLTPVGGIPARLESERDALLVPVGDPVELRKALARLRDPGLRDELARRAHATLAGAFVDPDAATQLDRILREPRHSRRRSEAHKPADRST
jgi:glycosyltransferase involved in cell wall biosynthesis